jgi:hypothetical protein
MWQRVERTTPKAPCRCRSLHVETEPEAGGMMPERIVDAKSVEDRRDAGDDGGHQRRETSSARAV